MFSCETTQLIVLTQEENFIIAGHFEAHQCQVKMKVKQATAN